MNALKTLTAGFAMALGSAMAMATSISAAPLAKIIPQEQISNSDVQLVQEKKWRYDRKRHGIAIANGIRTTVSFSEGSGTRHLSGPMD
jgi:hypothetical protein